MRGEVNDFTPIHPSSFNPVPHHFESVFSENV